MVRDELSVLSAFLTVAEERSFTRAAKRLGVSTSALSHAMQGLEERFGVRLLARTTRSVAPTHAGEQLIGRLRPALGDIRGALDMITFRVSKDHRPAIVGSPRYFESHAKPVHPRDLTSHRCINFRHGSAGVYRWEFDKGKQSLTVAVNGPLIVDDVEIMVRAALDGVGLAFMSEDRAAPHLARGELVRVLEDWCPPFPGFFLYYPRQRQLPAALAALIETLRVRQERNM